MSPGEDPLSTFQLDPRSGVSLATQICTRIALQIADGDLAPGDLLPSVRSLAGRLGVNVNTVRAAYARLEADGLVQTRHGVGTVVLATPTGGLPNSAVPFGVNTIAVLVADLGAFYLPLVRGIQDVASDRGTLVLIADARDSPRLADAMTRRLIARGVDGIIAVSVGRMPDQLDSRVTRLPIVHVDQPDRRGYSLLFDGEGAGFSATSHLIDHGHDRIGLITAPLIWANVAEVSDGYRRAIEVGGADASAELVSEVPEFTIEAGRAAMARLLDLPHPPSAVFAAGSTLALGALTEAKSRGVRVPRDLAIVGYTDTPMAELVDPPLTMVEVPVREIGVRAMRMLSDLIDGKKPRRRRTVLDPELIVRQSCGPHDRE
ncbi:substrate-binding domain-containing protein [Microbacterium sp. B2969]|uniref:Substrate-binding domain-containing protein n=1 Tax=Microbacterium alkaliflavum TaxID=3248839 RepID=A0ABW7QBB8_9MICO